MKNNINILPVFLFVLLLLPDAGAQTAGRYLQLADSIYYSDPDSSFALCNCAGKEITKLHDKKLEAKVRLCRVRYLLLKSRYEESSEELNSAIEQLKASGDKNNLARAYNSKAILLDRLGDKNGKYNYENEAVRLYEETGNISGLVKMLGNLSLSYTYEKRFKEAADCLDRILMNIDKLRQTEIYFYYQNRGILHMHQGAYNKAVLNLEAALDIAREQKMLDSEITAMTRLGESLISLKQYGPATSYLDQAQVLAQNNHLDFELDQVYTALIGLYTAQEKYRQAFETLELQNVLRAKHDRLQSIHRIKERDNRNNHTNELEAMVKVLKAENKKLSKKNTGAEESRWVTIVLPLVLLAFILWTVYTLSVMRRKLREQRSTLERLYKEKI